jgi:DNA mismatch repair protein MutS2
LFTDHTLRVIEYDRVLSQLGDRAESVPGRERVMAIRPFADFEKVRERQARSRESIALHQSTIGFPSTAHDDIRPVLAPLHAAGTILEIPDLLKLARFLRVVREAKDVLSRDAVGPILADLGAALVPAQDLESRITHAIDPSGQIQDGATPRLGRLRRQAVATREALRGRLESFLTSRELRHDPDGYVTIRGGRYVISVPAGDRSKVQGIVHDQSASGHTFFIEPFAVVDENNALARCEAEVREEERRIIAELSDRASELLPALARDVDLLTELDVCRATARLATELEMIVPDVLEGSRRVRLVGCRHPLMLAQAAERGSVIPLELTMDADVRILILTGPNMGGKTVALKTLGVSAIMAMAGLPVAASPGTEFPHFRTIVADIGDEQSIERNLSTFASHLRHLVEFMEKRQDPALILLDELGTGTDPAEGGALGRAYLEMADGPDTKIIATTHLPALKAFAAEYRGAVNGSMSFDEDSLAPRFTLEIGVPGRSHAFEIAARLSFPRPVLERARALLTTEERRMDHLLAEVERARQRAADAERRTEAIQREAEAKLQEAQRRQGEAERILREARSAAAEEADEMLRETRAFLKETRRQLTTGPVSNRTVEESGRRLREKEREVAVHRPPRPDIGADYPSIPAEEVRPGVKLWSIDLGAVVIADEVPSSRGMVHVTKSGIRFAVSVARLRRPPGDAPLVERHGGIRAEIESIEPVRTEIDLRGMSGDEAVRALERYLDSAVLNSIGIVRIIHGKGTGVLRQRVSEVLSSHAGVIDFRPGEAGEGGGGVTVARLGDH